MQTVIDITGQKFHRLRVVERVLEGTREARWLCVCDCGTQKILTGSVLRRGDTRSCGCLNQEKLRARATHGMSKAAVYRNWATMRQRCSNPLVHNYADYGGRGITVCARWEKFELFLEDMGMPPNGCSIERRDNERGYNKQNCYWATRTEQNHNKRNNRLLTVGALTLPLSAWAKELGVAHATLRERLDRGWSVEDACTRAPRPVRRTGKVIHISSVGE